MPVVEFKISKKNMNKLLNNEFVNVSKNYKKPSRYSIKANIDELSYYSKEEFTICLMIGVCPNNNLILLTPKAFNVKQNEKV